MANSSRALHNSRIIKGSFGPLQGDRDVYFTGGWKANDEISK